MTTIDPDRVRDEVREKYAVAALAVSDDAAGCCGSSSGCGTSACCDSSATPAFGSDLYADAERDALPVAAVWRASAAAPRPPSPSCARARPSSTSAGRRHRRAALGAPGRADRQGLRRRHDRRDARARPPQRGRGRGDQRRVPEGRSRHPAARRDVDVIISNCVINLSTDKPAVFARDAPRAAAGRPHRHLRHRRRGPARAAARAELGSHVGCIAGALSTASTPRCCATPASPTSASTFTHAVADGMHGAIVRARGQPSRANARTSTNIDSIAIELYDRADGSRERAQAFAALGDPHRLAMVDALAGGDLTAQEVAAAAGVPTNLAAHHLAVLERAGLIERRVSQGDRRRRYVVLRPDARRGSRRRGGSPPGLVLFVCTHNSARSQFAAGRWRLHTGGPAASAGSAPSEPRPPARGAGAGAAGSTCGRRAAGYDAVEVRPRWSSRSATERARRAFRSTRRPRTGRSPTRSTAGRPSAFAVRVRGDRGARRRASRRHGPTGPGRERRLRIGINGFGRMGGSRCAPAGIGDDLEFVHVNELHGGRRRPARICSSSTRCTAAGSATIARRRRRR